MERCILVPVLGPGANWLSKRLLRGVHRAQWAEIPAYDWVRVRNAALGFVVVWDANDAKVPEMASYLMLKPGKQGQLPNIHCVYD